MAELGNDKTGTQDVKPFPITMNSVYAFGRHAFTAAMTVVATLATIHILNAPDASHATEAINQIGTGITNVIAGLSTLFAIASGVYAGIKASPLSQIFSLLQQRPQTIIVTDKDLADKVPSNAVVSNTDVKVVSK